MGVAGSVNGEVGKHLDLVMIVDFILHPSLRSGLVHFEPSDL